MRKENIIRNICMGLFFFLSGVEYAVILPSLNGYLKTFGAQQYFLGIVMSSYSLTGLLAAPVYGRITDKTKSTKLCVIVGNCFEIAGNFLYFASTNKYMVLSARLIAGVGSGVESSIFGMISRTTSKEERTKVFSLFMSLRQLGLIVGPAFNLFLHDLNLDLGPYHVDEYTSPGLLMAIIWFSHTLLFLTLYTDAEKNPPSSTECRDTGKDEKTLRPRSTSVVAVLRNQTFIKEFLREEVIVCLAITFLVMFSQTGLETSVPPLSLLFFGWGGLENSYLFCGASVIVVASLVSVSFLSKRFSDRAMMLSGCIGMVATYVFYLSFSIVLRVGEYPSTPPWLLSLFITVPVMLTISISFLWVPQAVLFSKITSPQTQAFNQGVRMVAMGFGQILGPIWASSLSTLERLPVMLAVNTFLIFMLVTMIGLSYDSLQPSSRPVNMMDIRKEVADGHSPPLINESIEDDVGETTRLLPKNLNQNTFIN